MASGEHTLDTLRRELYERGLRFIAKRAKWNRAHLAKLLRHPFYIGEILWRGQVYPGKHEPLVDRRTWRRVQDVLDGRTRTRSRQRRQFAYGHGLIRCAHCGYSITGELHKQRYRYYRCAQVQYQEHPARPAWVPEPVLDAQVTAMLERIVLPEPIYEWATAYLKRTEKKNAAHAERELRTLRRRAAATQADLDALLLKAAQTEDKLAEGFMRLARQKQEELSLTNERIRQVKEGRTQNGGEAAEILELAQHLSERFVTLAAPQKRQIVESVFLVLPHDVGREHGNV